MVPRVGLEPTSLSALVFETSMFTNFIIWGLVFISILKNFWINLLTHYVCYYTSFFNFVQQLFGAVSRNRTHILELRRLLPYPLDHRRWRKRWDSNPRYQLRYDGLVDRWFQPLIHTSIRSYSHHLPHHLLPAIHFRTHGLIANVEPWCRLSDSNRRPIAYKAIALPTELKRHLFHHN